METKRDTLPPIDHVSEDATNLDKVHSPTYTTHPDPDGLHGESFFDGAGMFTTGSFDAFNNKFDGETPFGEIHFVPLNFFLSDGPFDNEQDDLLPVL